MFNYFNHREELIKRNTEETREITKKYISLYKTNHALLDIGIGQAAVYLKGEVSEINQLILLKIEKGLYGYLNQLNIIKIKLNKKNLSNFSFTAFDEDNLINFLLTKKIIINPVKAQKTAENIIKIMHKIENIPKKARKLLKNNQDLTPEILLYQYILIGFVLDILYLNEEKYFHRQYIAVENNPDLLLEVSIKLAKDYKLSELTLAKFLTIMEDIPNIKQFYSLVENQTASSIVPIEHTNGLMGIATIVHLIINNKLPVGIGINTLPVHAGYFLKQRLITLDHDFQHAWDILKKKIFSADIMQPLMEICKEICMNHTEVNEKAIYEDYIVMFYILHENPRLSDASVLKLSVPHYLLPYSQVMKKNIIISDKDKKYSAIQELGVRIFESIGFIYFFLELYPEFQTELEKHVPACLFKNQEGKMILSNISPEITDGQIKNLVAIVIKYLAICMENFITRNKNILIKRDVSIFQMINDDTKELNAYAKAIYPKEQRISFCQII